jgi:Rps23 Pro-64 3,4-dihydroxylase Tpa1-like proline 4-hydroxylase
MSEFKSKNNHKSLDGRIKKKRKVLDIPKLDSPISPSLLTDSLTWSNLKEKHENSLPYKHMIIDPLCNIDRMKLIHDEVKHNMQTTYKETDLFKVFQTQELGNLGSKTDKKLAEKMPQLLALRNSIYSAEFRAMVSEVTGLNDLTDRVDSSINAYVSGCHLLCHDDVIGTRRVSYIIYLTDPEEEWLDTYGGALELYPLDPKSIVNRGEENGGIQGIPLPSPTAAILPKFNTMAFFVVQPGRSYHSVQEVFADGKPRISISGWFHGPDPPKGADAASLNQILTKGDDLRLFNTVDNTIDYDNIEEEKLKIQYKEDEIYLSKYINETYLQEDSINKINETFCEDSSIQLQNFIRPDIANKVVESTILTDRNCNLGRGKPSVDYNTGNGNGWNIVGPPHKRRHLLYDEELEIKDKCNSGELLNDIRNQVFRSPQFIRYLHRLTELSPLGYRDEIRRFRPGFDYTVAHYGAMTTIPKLDATLCFVDERNDDDLEDQGEGWESGDVGGFECYIEAEIEKEGENKDNEAAEVYKSHDTDKEESLLSVTPGCNVLSLVMRDQEIMRFVKYVGVAASGSRWDISMEYEIEPVKEGEEFVGSDTSSDDDDIESNESEEGGDL